MSIENCEQERRKKKKKLKLSEKAQQIQSYVQTDATTPTIGMVAQQCWELLRPPARIAKSSTGFNSGQQPPTTRNNMQQGVQMEATCNIQQCWELLANIDAPVCTGLKRRVLTVLHREL